MRRVANVDQRGSVLIVSSYSRTTAGFWILNGCLALLAVNVTDGELGSAVRKALDKSEHDVPTPDPSADLIAPVLELAGVRRYSDYLVGARSIGVREDEEILLVPKENTGMKNGFVPLRDRTERLPVGSDVSELGAGVRAALDRAGSY